MIGELLLSLALLTRRMTVQYDMGRICIWNVVAYPPDATRPEISCSGSDLADTLRAVLLTMREAYGQR